MPPPPNGPTWPRPPSRLRLADHTPGATMLLPALTLVCAIVAITAALLGPAYTSLLFVFKPLTTVLVIAYAWPRGAESTRQQRFVRIGLVLSLVGDVCLLWPKEGFLPGLVSFLLAHLAYIAAFCVPVRFAARSVSHRHRASTRRATRRDSARAARRPRPPTTACRCDAGRLARPRAKDRPVVAARSRIFSARRG